MFKRTEVQHAPTEGAGLGAGPAQWDSEPSVLTTSAALSLDSVAAKIPADRDLTMDECKKIIRRAMRLPSYDKATVDAVFTSLLSLGALQSVVWRLGPRIVRRGDISTPHTRRKATRQQYEMVMNEQSDWIACPREQAPAMRRRVALFALDMEERDAERKAEQRRLLRAQVEAEAVS